MPHLVQMDKRYKDKGLTVIAAEVQNSPQDAIERVAKDARAEFTITKGTTRPPTLRGIPHAVVVPASSPPDLSGLAGDYLVGANHDGRSFRVCGRLHGVHPGRYPA